VPSFTKQKVASTSRFLYNVPSTGLQLTIQCDWYTFHVRSCFFSFFFLSVYLETCTGTLMFRTVTFPLLKNSNVGRLPFKI
jgi:hypothetical protein